MPKYIIRAECMVEFTVEADTIEDAQDLDLNLTELDKMPHEITEIYDVIEAEEL
ncbi:hypothetical protein IFE17_09820 [Actinobacillus sp. GY-402]|nr:hypothetical protein IFE17_09195 [Actinobacillus sp. GY-402]QOF67421.1 hypothetical protein IFE17_09820 [Actinobacillus sp. GY-402]